MTIFAQTNAAVAEQPSSSAQQVEWADTVNDTCQDTKGQHQEGETEKQDYVGPWPLRRRSNSSWTVLTAESSAARDPISKPVENSAAIKNINNPFIAGFALENPFCDKFQTEDSSSVAMEESVDVADSWLRSGRSEFSLTLEQVDRQTEAIQCILREETSSSWHNEDGRQHNAIQRDGGGQLPDSSTGSERQEQPSAQDSWIPTRQQISGNIEREAAATTLSQLEAENCQACREQGSVARAGRWMLGLTAATLGASPYLVYHIFKEELMQASAMIKEKQRTFLFLSLLAIPITSALSMVFLAWLGLNVLGPHKRRMSGGTEYFRLWLCFTFFTVCGYFLLVAVIYKYAI
ncbi:hypothetical protein Z517_12558 [Fonsecaea pedrosoi CBS 271.37]|uniref:Transmembrane protein n=1 Tax=Fonsecaea pedrosoi CBS 271.37 TaxID=1442368 RepID=A0A0D2G032_9EURO|nr:uncharacterized protein Z517_12558 [Fonsecaea pedrosoi CBS 271.37]KIW74148.1 hypothetical protein Z517_12558 [Fonsecaea pedrosoi CBS 271.37]